MTKSPQNDAEILERLDKSLADDVLSDAYSDEDIDHVLRAMGDDPVSVRRRGAALAVELLRNRRLAWQEKARRKIERAHPLFTPRADYSGLRKPEMLVMARQAMSNPRLSSPVSQLFHKRKPEDISEEELRALLVEIEALGRLDSLDDEDPERR